MGLLFLPVLVGLVFLQASNFFLLARRLSWSLVCSVYLPAAATFVDYQLSTQDQWRFYHWTSQPLKRSLALYGGV